MPTTSIKERVEQAIAVAQKLSTIPWQMLPTAECSPPSRCVAIGDAQAPLATYFTVLAEQNLLGDDGMLAPDVSILSIGDHFDYASPDLAQSSREGYALLRWLAEHPPQQAIILLGNHDTVRVQDLGGFSDRRFEAARALALQIEQLAQIHGDRSASVEQARNQFYIEYPEITKPELAKRDYDSFTTAQRELVIRLMLAGRCQLAAVGKLPNSREILLTHAGVIKRDLQVLGLNGEVSPVVIASRINKWLKDAVNRVRPAWERGELIPLDLSPLHIAGTGGREGGGLLFHRPANPDRPTSLDDSKRECAKEFGDERPRRYHPQELPLGLIQACGHTGHSKCLEELVPWVSEAAKKMVLGKLRTLRVTPDQVNYDVGIDLDGNEAALLMIDGEMNRVCPQDYEVLNLVGWS